MSGIGYGQQAPNCVLQRPTASRQGCNWRTSWPPSLIILFEASSAHTRNDFVTCKLQRVWLNPGRESFGCK